MNRRFLRWVLDVTHKVSKQDFAVKECAVRWNSLMCAVVFTLCLPIFLLRESENHWLQDGLNGFSLFCMVAGCWAIHINMRFFHRMRRKNAIKKAKQKTRRMLNQTPYCLGFLILLSGAVLLARVLSPDKFSFQLLVMSLLLCLAVPYLGTRIWIVIATAPFHACCKKG